jgi:hypothetical protein
MVMRTLARWNLGGALALSLLVTMVGPASAQRMGLRGRPGNFGFRSVARPFAGAPFRSNRSALSVGINAAFPTAIHRGSFGGRFRVPFHRRFPFHHRRFVPFFGFVPFYYPFDYGSFGFTPYNYGYYPYAPYSFSTYYPLITYPYYSLPDNAPDFGIPPFYPNEPETNPALPPQNEEPPSDSSDYYLYRHPERSSEIKKVPGLAQTVSDIQKAFLSGDIALLGRHVPPKDTLLILSRNHPARFLTGRAYLSQTEAAFPEMHTLQFDLNQIEPASDGAWSVSGTHVLRGSSGRTERFHIGFILNKQGDTWAITEVHVN